MPSQGGPIQPGTAKLQNFILQIRRNNFHFPQHGHDEQRLNFSAVLRQASLASQRLLTLDYNCTPPSGFVKHFF
jgi:hypothetical protein